MPEIVGWVAILFASTISAIFSIAAWDRCGELLAHVKDHRDETEEPANG